MKKREYFYLLSIAVCLAAAGYFINSSSAQQAIPAKSFDYQIGAILYQQKAGEYRALAYQAFNIARERLDEDKKAAKKLPKAERKRPRAVIVDIDETVLDNSPSNAYIALNNLPFNTRDWYAWSEMRKAKPVPGAVDFINYAVDQGVKIYYISNRDEVQKQATIDNLRAVGFKDISDENVMLRNTESAKGPRRQIVAAKYRVVFLMGDNLDDFSEIYERKSTVERFAGVDRDRFEFGKRFIALPNAMYGTWETALYNYERLTESQKAERRVNALELP
jgi:5'-nucleotidase (lipoprotein e(P4) family)